MMIYYDLIKVSHVSYRTQKFIILSTIGIRKYLNKNRLTLCLAVSVIRSRNSGGAGQGEENTSKNLRLKPEGKGTCRRSRRRWEDNINPLTPNDHYNGRTAPLTSRRCILYIYSTNMGTEYFKLGIYSPFFSLQNAVFFFIILKYLVPVLFTFNIQSVLKFKKIIPTPKG